MENLAKDPKLLVDCSREVDEVLAKVDNLKNAGRLDEAFEFIFPLEKKARNGCDGPSVTRLIVWMITSLLEEQRWDDASQAVINFSKKRGQLNRAVTEVVRTVMTWLDKVPSKEIVLKLIETLCIVTEGKIFVEVERARIILRLSKMKEDEGNIAEAANLLQEVQIETSISMEAKEKTNFILEQMRLVLARKDYIRCQIVCKRINKRLLEAEDYQMEKLRFFNYMIFYHIHQDELMATSECMRACLHTPIIQKPSSGTIDMEVMKPFVPQGMEAASLAKWYLEGMIVFILLSSHSSERNDACMNILKKEAKALEKTPAFKTMLEQFLNKDLIKYPPSYLDEVMKHPILASDELYANAEQRRNLFRTRIIQHNLIVISIYYKRTYLQRLSEMFDVPVDEVETELCELILSKSIHAKISRSTGVIEFHQTETVKDRMDDWSLSMSRMLDVLEEANNLLEKEKLLQKTHFAKKGLTRA